MPKGEKPRYAEFGKRLVYYMGLGGIKPGRLLKTLGVKDASTISRWRSGVAKPEPHDLVRLAAALQVRPGDLDPDFVPPGVHEAAPGRAEGGPEAVQKLVGQIIIERLAQRDTIPRDEVVEYLLAAVDAAAGRPIKLPPATGTAAARVTPARPPKESPGE